MNTQVAGGNQPHSRRIRFPVGLGLAGFFGILLLAAAMRDSSAVTDSKSVISPGVSRYFNTGQWRADARTLVAVVRYLFEPEPLVLPSRPMPPFELAMPTNYAPLPRKA